VIRPDAYISTVQTAPASYALADLATVKLRLGISAPTWNSVLGQFILDASAAAARYMNDPIVAETRVDQIWPWRDSRLGGLTSRAPSLQLKRWPLISVSSVVETIAGTATTLVAGTDYIADPDYGRLTRLDSYGRPRAWNADPLVVTYSAGYASVPADIGEAVSEMVKARFYAMSRDPAIRERNVEGVMQTQYWFGAGPGADTDMPPTIQAKLDRYRVPVTA
jgi:hypothetical protein